MGTLPPTKTFSFYKCNPPPNCFVKMLKKLDALPLPSLRSCKNGPSFGFIQICPPPTISPIHISYPYIEQKNNGHGVMSQLSPYIINRSSLSISRNKKLIPGSSLLRWLINLWNHTSSCITHLKPPPTVSNVNSKAKFMWYKYSTFQTLHKLSSGSKSINKVHLQP